MMDTVPTFKTIPVIPCQKHKEPFHINNILRAVFFLMSGLAVCSVTEMDFGFTISSKQ